MNEEEALKEIIHICGEKSNAHYRSIIAATFGLFGLLNLLKGQGRTLFTAISPIFLSAFYIILLFYVFYAFARSTHYSKIADLAMARISEISLTKRDVKATETLEDLWSSLYDKARDDCPDVVKQFIKFRRKKTNIVYYIAGIAFILLIILWLAVLFLP